MLKTLKNNKEASRKDGTILKIKVNSTSVKSVLTRVNDFISDNIKFYVVTPNPELILMAEDNKKLAEALNSADLSVPDGVGLKIANPSLKIIKGRELFMDLIKFAGKKGWKVFLLGGLGNEAKLASEKLENLLKTENRKLKINYNAGPKLNGDAQTTSEEDRKIESRVISQINTFKPQLLFVAFGNPKQEIWIKKNLSRLNIGGAMAVGGAFRYVAGITPLPPKWMAACGLEWLWRLVTEPKRIGRIFRAVVVFPFKIWMDKLA